MGEKTNLLLSILRGFLISLLAFLLIGPLIKHFGNQYEPATIVVAIDNSSSVTSEKDTTKLQRLKKDLSLLTTQLKEANVEIRTFNGKTSADKIPAISFDHPETNLSQLFGDIQNDYTNKNLAGIVLASDGVYNIGTSPLFSSISTPVYSIGLGDTLPRKDIEIRNLLYNKITYTGNKFPLVAEIHHSGFAGKSVTVQVKKNGIVIDKKPAVLKGDKGLAQVEFLISSEKNGLHHYTIEVPPAEQEFTTENNLQHAYIDIIEGREKVLILASSPHPDIKSLKSSLEKKKNYDVQVVIAGISNYKKDKFDMVIYHQLPDNYNTLNNILSDPDIQNLPALYIFGQQSNITLLGQNNQVVKFSGRAGQFDNVTGEVNSAFDRFQLDESDVKNLKQFPPLTVPYGTYNNVAAEDVLLYQKVGSVVTNKPLLALNNKNPKRAVFLGEGLWQWSLQEFRINQNTDTFDKLIGSIVQYLSAKEDKRKFRCNPVATEFRSGDPVYFETEIYNDIYEKIYGQKVDLQIKDEDGNTRPYSFVHSPNTTRFEIKGLQEGVYQYTASTTISGKIEKSSGEFSIRNIHLESINSTADHALLKSLSSRTGGQFFNIDEVNKLSQKLSTTQFNRLIHTSEEIQDIIDMPLLFFLLLLLISLEWGVRKYKGSY